jgi:hypothetical protein
MKRMISVVARTPSRRYAVHAVRVPAFWSACGRSARGWDEVEGPVSCRACLAALERTGSS